MRAYCANLIPLPAKPAANAAANRAQFELPSDGCIQVLAFGEYPHPDVGIQVIDQPAVAAIAAHFNRHKQGKNFPGMLVDRDHFSHDPNQSSEALAWADDLEVREDGLWAKCRWTSLGESEVTGGVLRLTSPVLEGFEDLGGGRKRPTKMTSIGLTNAPNIKGMRPITNRDEETKTTMDYKKALCRATGLPETATDAELDTASNALPATLASRQTEVTTANNRVTAVEKDATTLKAENTRLTTELDSLRGDLVDRDIAALGDRVTNKEAVRASLLKDRTGTLALLSGVGVTGKAVPKPVHNRNGNNPGNPDADGTDEAAKTAAMNRATSVGVRARAIMKEQGLQLSDAYDRAEREITAEAKA